MKLDLDCIRDVLLCIEENTGLRKRCFFVDSGLENIAKWVGSVIDAPNYQQDLLEKYGNDVLIYHVRYCLAAKLAVRDQDKDEYKIWIDDLTPEGHEFLAKIRDTKQWSAVKKGAASVRNYSLSAISAIAEGVTTAAISAFLKSETNH